MDKGFERIERLGWIEMQRDFPSIEKQKPSVNARLTSGGTTGNFILSVLKER